jgi:hypothetical protein
MINISLKYFIKEYKYMKTLNGITFLETKDIRKALKIGNQTCLELFHKTAIIIT